MVFWIPNPAFLAHFLFGLGIARELVGFKTKELVRNFAGRGVHLRKGQRYLRSLGAIPVFQTKIN